MTTTDIDCPRCGSTEPFRRIGRVFTEDSVIETWECVSCEYREVI